MNSRTIHICTHKTEMTSLSFQRFGSLIFCFVSNLCTSKPSKQTIRIKMGTGWRWCIQIHSIASLKHVFPHRIGRRAPTPAMWEVYPLSCFVHNKYKILVVPIILLLSNDRFSLSSSSSSRILH